MSQLKENKHLGAVIGSIEYRDEHVERISKRLGQPDYNFVNYCRNTTASSLFNIYQ